MNILAIIPARSGSKGIKNKNIINLAGHPLIAYSIEAAKSCPKINKIICSTDSEKIAKIAEKYGASVPFLRPIELAQDDTTDLPVFKHAIKWLIQNLNYKPEIIVHLRPTSPIRFSEHINEAVEIIINNPKADSLRAVCQAPCTPYKMWVRNGIFLKPLLSLPGIEEPYNMPRQKLPIVYWQTGYIDIIRFETIMDLNSMTGKNILPFIIDRSIVVDIDSKYDLIRAKALIRSTNCVKP